MTRRTPDDSLTVPDALSSLGRELLALDLELLGVHLVATCVAVYFAVRFDVGAWRGFVVGLVAYLVALLRHPERSRS
ncbi:hypothetical protein [Halorussus salinus]|uniref:hypothetical protein n=1 Tax=Halorussus salinus TaxID=1364935 RepID=UPI001091A800|nr:hypothetical protein [Halorussus salinus]